MRISVPDPVIMESVGRCLAAECIPGIQVHLSGELGSGKTTLVRGFLRGLGYQGKVKSPTYTLIEGYEGLLPPVFHFDFYRIEDPGEIAAIGFRDYAGGEAVCLIEWPEKGGDLLAAPDLLICFPLAPEGGRELEFKTGGDTGKSLIYKLSQRLSG